MNGTPEPTEADIFANSDPFGSGPSPFDAGTSPYVEGAPTIGAATSSFSATRADLSCIAVHRELEVFMDGELPAPQHRAVSEHLTACPPCQRVHTFQVQLRSVVAAKAIDPMPEDVRARITRALGFD